MTHLSTLVSLQVRRGWRAGLLAVLTLLLASLSVSAQVVAGRAAPTVDARKQVLREALHLTPNADLRAFESLPDPLGFAHEQYQLYYKGVKVEHGQVRVHSRAGKVESVSGETAQPAAGRSAQPGLTEAVALQRALASIGARVYKWQVPGEDAALKQQTGQPTATYQPHGELVWVGDFRQPEATRPLVLAWKFDIYAHEPVSRAHYYVDAQTGQVVLRDNIIKHVNAPGATFATRYVGTRTATTDNYGSGYRLRQTTTSQGVTTLNVRKGNTFSAAVDFLDNDNNWTAAEHDNATFDNAALDAHLGAQVTQDYWATVHGRDSYDDKGSVLTSYVHYDEVPGGAGTDNAFWNGTAMLYGDGNTQFKPLTAIDICGHEIGHAVCETTANLVYANESGALNEALSDIWGACVENHFDPTKQLWLIGEDVTIAAGAALRSMSNPNQFNDPDTYKGTNWRTGTADYGGVHHNSGVLNFWFYLLSTGGAGTNDFGTAYSVGAITMPKAARITYRAERFYMSASTNYAGARLATMQAALDLYGFGSPEAASVAQAWRAVGLGDATGNTEAAPTITSFTPTSGLPGTSVTLTGTNLSATFSVAFNGVAAKLGTVTSATSVTVTVPAGATTGPISLTTPSGTATSATAFTITAAGAAPTITGFTPAAGQTQGGSVTITGTNLTGATGVSFNGTAATILTNTATTITTTVPVGATSGSLTVTNANGTATAPTSFPVLPAISSFSPGSGAVGAAITITGTSFTGATAVRFNGAYATSFSVGSATTITATVPNGASTGTITVRTPSGTATSATNFTVTPSLAFDSFLPVRGAWGSVVSLRGRGFTGTTAIAFGSVSAPTFTVVSDGEIWATVPTNAATGIITITTPLGTVISSGQFTALVPGAPTISSFTPASGSAGTSVTLTGTGFSGATAVKFNGTTATFTVNSATSITTTAPAGATTGLISVTNASGTGSSETPFGLPPTNDVCSASVPMLTCGTTIYGSTLGATTTGDPQFSCNSVSPTNNLNGGGGVFYQFVGTGGLMTLSTCTYADFDTRLYVYTGGCGTYTCVTADNNGCGDTGGPSSLSFTSTAGTTYLVFIDGPGVLQGTTQGIFTLTLTCLPAPTITSFTPASGTATTNVTLTGTNFTGASAVTFGGAAAGGFTINSATQITATVGSLAFTGPIRVTTPGGIATSAASFTVTAGAPTLTSFTPATGPPTTAVTLTGTDFSGATAVRFNGTAATFTVVNNATITTSVPTGATTGTISVTTPSGTATSGASFTVIPPPANDQCAGAIALSCGGSVSGSIVSATTTGDPTATCAGTAPSAGVFYSFVGTGASVEFATCTASYDGTLFAYTGACGGTLTCVGGDDDGCGGSGSGSGSKLTIATTLGTTYWLFVSGFDGARGSFTLTATCVPVPPVITGLSPTSGTAGTSVTLTGTGLIGTSPGATTVTVNGVAVTPTTLTATSLTFGVPAGASPTQSITVTTPDGTSPANTSFTVRLALTGSNPVVNARTAPRANSAVGLTFSEPVTAASVTTAASQVKVHSAQVGGRKAGTWTGGGTSTIAYTSSLSGSRANFQAGEVVSVTVPATVLSAGGLAVPKRVYQFTAATGGTGTGLFGAATTVTGGNGANGVALGDVNGDGLLDIIWPNYNGTTVSVALATGPGTYAAATAITVAGNPVTVNLADLDGDGDLDFVTANYGNPSGTGSNLSIGLNNGAGTFTVSTLTTATGPRWVAPGDVDGDGDLDLLVPVGNGVQVYANNGSGSFALLNTVAGINFAIAAAAADVDGDGDLDLLTANYFQSNTVSVRLNDGSGTFSGSQQVAVGTQPFHVAVADVDGDGDLDLLTANQGASTASIRFNNGSGTFAPPTIAANGEVAVVSTVTYLALGDVDADGDLDLLASSGSGTSLRLNNGSGVFSNPGANGTIAGAAGFPALADVDNDGDLDLTTASGNSSAVRLNQALVPTLTSLNPTSSPVGTSVTLTGTSFTGATGISFNGTAATSFSVTNATTATAIVPSGATTGNVTLTTPDGTSNGVAFTVLVNLPTITSFTPAAGTYQGQAVTITGTNLTGATAVSFNGTLATITSNSATSIATSVPVGATTGSLTVTTPSGTATSATSFNVAPFVSAFTPTSGPVGTSVTITGTTLTGATVVKFNTTNAASYSVNSATQIVAVVAAGTTTGKVTVTTPSGTHVTGLSFTVTASPVPTVTSFAPTSGTAGTVVTLTGTNFTGATAVLFNTTAATSFTLVSATSITATVPAGATTGPVKVTTPGGTATSAGTFTVCQPPATPGGFSYGGAYNGKFYFVSTSTANWPSARQACVSAGGDLVAIGSAAENAFVYSLTAGVNDLWIGYNDLATEGSFVWSNGEANNYENWYAGEPNDFNGEDYTGIYSASGAWNDYGSSNLLRGVLELSACVAAPTITSFSPTAGPVGTVVTLTGTNFTGATGVTFNGTAAAFSVASAASITTTVPASASTGTIAVTTAGGTVTSATAFTVTVASATPPAVTTLSPARNAKAAARASNVAATFDQPMSAGSASALRVFSPSGKPAGTTAVSGATVSFDPTTDLKPGESLSATLTTAAQNSGGQTLATGQVWQFTAAASGGTGAFSGTGSGAVGTTPRGVSLADVDGDGDLDLLAANAAAGQNSVSVRLNSGAGVFSGTTNVAVGTTPYAVTTGDVDGDGDADLLAANYGAASVSIRLNSGGSFSGTGSVAVGTSPVSLTLGDVDADGDLDLLTANYGSGVNSVSVRFNDGTGTFSGTGSVAVGTGPFQVVLADVDTDGDLDLLTANLGTGANSVSVRLNDGLGAFSGTQNVPVGAICSSVAVGDVDGDGDADIVATNYLATASAALQVRLNSGSGTFATTGTSVLVAASPYAVALADVDADGDLDALTSNYGNASVSVRLNSGAGVFAGTTNAAVAASPIGLAAGDVDGDGDVDFVTSGSTTAAVSVRLNQNAGGPAVPTLTGFTPASGPVGTSVTITGTSFTGATAVAFNGTAATYTVNSATSITTTVPTGATTGMLTVTTAGGTATSATAFTVTVVTPAPTITSFTPASGPVGTSVTITGTNFSGASAVKFNGTTATYTVVSATSLTTSVPAGATTGTLSVTTAGGTATSATAFTVTAAPVTPPVITTLSPARNAKAAARASNVAVTFDQPISAGSATALRVFSPSGKPAGTTAVSGATVSFDPTTDLKPGETVSATITPAAQNSGGQTLAQGQVWQFTAAATGGTGAFSGTGSVATGTTPRGVSLADVDGDGDLDVLTANAASGQNSVSVRLNSGAGVFSGTTNVAVGTTPYAVATGDVDGDGDADLLAANYGSASVSVRLNTGGSFSGSGSVAVGTSPVSLTLGDIDGDGDLDLLTANYGSGVNSVSVRFNDGAGSFSGTGSVVVGTGPFQVVLADVDNDGDLDLLTANLGAGANSVSVRTNDGTGAFSGTQNVPVGAVCSSVAVGDVDGDGDADIVATNYLATASAALQVRLNSGSGTFATTGTSVLVAASPYAVVLADVDGDGDLDALTSNYGNASVSVRLNSGAGVFAGTTNAAVAASPIGLAAGDVDGDGDVDFVTSGSTTAAVSIRLNQNGAAPSVPTISSFTPASGPVGTSVTLTGTNLTGATAVAFNGTAQTTITNNTATSLTVSVPVGTSTGPLTVTTSGGASAASSQPFTVLPSPTLSGIAPAIGVPGSVLTLTGTNLTGTTSIAFTGSAGVKVVTTGFTVNGAGTSITGVVVPAGAQTGPVRVTTSGGASAVGSVFFSRAKTLAAAYFHTVAVRADGSLWAWGRNTYGQLGLGTSDSIAHPTPVRVGTATNWVSVAAGQYHTVAVRADGSLWTWGGNNDGQLGLGNNTQQNSPVQVGTATNWVSVASGNAHTVAVRADGSLWAWGRNDRGQLGQGNFTSQTSPVQVGTATNWVSAAGGGAHTMAVRTDGTLWTWGWNAYGQLGQGTGTTFYPTPTQVGTATNWVSVTAGYWHTMALRTNGTRWTWGSNDYGQLGQGNITQQTSPVQADTVTSWTSAAGGYVHGTALRANGTLWTWGLNDLGALGLGTIGGQQNSPVQVGTATSWVNVAAGAEYAAGEQSCRAVWAWGSNAYGKVGNGTTTDQLNPVLIFNGVSLASFSPASAVAGTTVAVTGTGLTALTALTVNGVSALASVTGSTATGFSFVVPAGATVGVGTVSATASCGTASSAAFTVTAGSTPPVITTLSPARNARAAARASNVAVTFDQPMSSASATALRVFSPSGKPAGTATVSGATVSFDPTTDLKPGETVSATITPAAQNGSSQALAQGQVWQFTAAASGGTGAFSGTGTVATGTTPRGVSLADIDGDGDLDVLTANAASGQNSVSVRLNSGAGVFSGTTSVAVGTTPYAVTTGDVDGDGDADLLAANYGSASVSVRLNSGGSFSGSGSVAVGTSPVSLTLGDIDADGDLDLLTANYGSGVNSVSVRFNDGAGTFSGTGSVAVGTGPYQVVLADVDNDGDLDLLTANLGAGANSVSVRTNDGTGAFSGTQNVPVGAVCSSVAVGDVDGDGDADIVATNYLATASAALQVRLNTGAGTFAVTGTSVLVAASPFAVALADVDADGDLDALTSNYGNASVSVRLNSGAGVFSGTTNAAVAAAPIGLATGDVDGDGDLDFVTSGSTTAAVSVRLNQNAVAPRLLGMTTGAAPLTPRMSVLPNPAHGRLRISEASVSATEATLQDATGRIVSRTALAEGQGMLELAGLPAGVYVLRAGTQTCHVVVE